MGKNDEIGQLKSIKCTYPACQKRFDSEKEMKYHKRDDPEHDYCKKCNVDCDDWEGYLQHKIDAMTPWLDKRTQPTEGVQPMHIVCEFCGADFKSWGARKTHRERVSR